MTVTVESITASGNWLFFRPRLGALAVEEVCKRISGQFGSAMIVREVADWPADGVNAETTGIGLEGSYPGASGERLEQFARVLPIILAQEAA